MVVVDGCQDRPCSPGENQMTSDRFDDRCPSSTSNKLASMSCHHFMRLFLGGPFPKGTSINHMHI